MATTATAPSSMLLDDLDRLVDAVDTIAELRTRLGWDSKAQAFSEDVGTEFLSASSGFILEAAAWDVMASLQEDTRPEVLDRHARALRGVLELVRREAERRDEA